METQYCATVNKNILPHNSESYDHIHCLVV